MHALGFTHQSCKYYELLCIQLLNSELCKKPCTYVDDSCNCTYALRLKTTMLTKISQLI